MSFTIKMSGGDFEVLPSGRTVDINGLEKCAQDIAESLLNSFDPQNPYYYNGSEFWRLDEPNEAYDMFGVESMIESMAADAVERLMEQQENDGYVDDEELIDTVEFIRVWRIGSMSYAFHLHCVTASQDPVRVGFDINLEQQLPDSIESTGGDIPGTGVFL